ncbi:chain-length determining protein [Bordetella hinzii]|nr:chain-length determining protein [Bordetella hinzii]
MTSTEKSPVTADSGKQRARNGMPSIALFRRARQAILVFAILAIAYWLVFASDRYVSDATVIIRKTDSIAAPVIDLPMVVSGIPTVSRSDQLLLREYLLSTDMLKKLDAAIDLRSHYSDKRRDIISRMWFKDASMEWFYRHYLARTAVDYDDFAGVLRISAQAYDPETARTIANMLVEEGERYMNHLGHELAEVQVSFLTSQVDQAQRRFQQASQDLLAYQNSKGLVSPQNTAESINMIVAKLEDQRAQIQTQLAALPKTLERNHPNIQMYRQAIEAVDRQIAQEKARLAAPSGQTLNYTVEEFHRLQMTVGFMQDVYKAALAALEKGRMDATRMLEKVSVLQAATVPEYPMEPKRIYNAVVTLLLALLLIGILRLLESIVLDHVD